MAKKELLAFDPTKSTLIIGELEVYGYGEGTKVNISRSNGLASETVGVDGDISVNIDSRNNGELTFTLMHNSTFNNTIRAWLATVRATGNPFISLSFKDPSGGKLSTTAWFKTQPDYMVAQETSSQEWVLGLQDTNLTPAEGTVADVVDVFEAWSYARSLV